LTGNQPEYIPYLKDIEYLNLKLPGRLKTAVLAKAKPDKPETKKTITKTRKGILFRAFQFSCFRGQKNYN
jgi:hypothetical protein